MRANDARKITEQSLSSMNVAVLGEIYDKIKKVASNGRDELVVEIVNKCTDEILVTLRKEGYKVVAKPSQQTANTDMIKINW